MIEQLDFRITIFLLAAPMGIALTTFLIDMRIVCSKQYDLMISALQQSAFLPSTLGFWNGHKSIIARILVITAVQGIFLLPRFHIRKGRLDEDDFKNFPRYLKLKIVSAIWLNIIGFSWMMLGYFFIVKN